MHLGLLQSACWVEGRVAKPGYVVFGLVPCSPLFQEGLEEEPASTGSNPGAQLPRDLSDRTSCFQEHLVRCHGDHGSQGDGDGGVLHAVLRIDTGRPKDRGTALGSQALDGVPGIEVIRLEEPDALRTGQLTR